MGRRETGEGEQEEVEARAIERVEKYHISAYYRVWVRHLSFSRRSSFFLSGEEGSLPRRIQQTHVGYSGFTRCGIDTGCGS